MAKPKIITDLSTPTVHTAAPEQPMALVAQGVDPADASLQRQVMQSLCEHYPGWVWMVEIPRSFYGMKQNMILVRNIDTTPKLSFCYSLRKSELSGANLEKEVMRAGGSILERYNFRRGKFREDEIHDRQMIFEKPEV